MHLSNIHVGKTYAIRVPLGGIVYGTLVEHIPLRGQRRGESHRYTWKSDHPDATDEHWCYAEQIKSRVQTGTYLGNDGMPVYPKPNLPPFADVKEKSYVFTLAIRGTGATEEEALADAIKGLSLSCGDELLETREE